MREYPKSNDAPDALLMKAELLEAASRPAEAEKTYVKLAADYPDDDEAASALWRLGWIAWFRGNHTEATTRWSRLQGARGGQALRESATYWVGRAWEQRGDRDQAARQFAQLAEGFAAHLLRPARGQARAVARRRRGRDERSGQAARSSVAAFVFPADPGEALQGDPRFDRAVALREVGLREFADEELDELTRRSAGEPRRLYGLSAAYVADERYHMALRILRRSFQGAARSGGTLAARVLGDVLSARLARRRSPRRRAVPRSIRSWSRRWCARSRRTIRWRARAWAPAGSCSSCPTPAARWRRPARSRSPTSRCSITR